jgi:hypothetical protein
MCVHCPSAGERLRLCNNCGILSGPAPPSQISFWMCKVCNPDTPWNLTHSAEYARRKARRKKPAQVLLKKEGTEEWDVSSFKDPARFITERRGTLWEDYLR